MMKRWTVLIVLLLIVQNAIAQICNGSLGDPIVNITFGAGSNPGSSLAAATTSYQYSSADCPNDGFYSIRNATNNCFGATWHSITDHTGDANGYFMLVNASLQPSAFYLDTVRNLCGNTTYEFAAWILNILKPTACGGNGNQPNLTFSIERTDGTLLQSYNTAQIAATNSPEWKQFGFYFTTPSSTSDVVLRIINNSQGGCGNDLALDDITFRACGPQITTSIAGTSASSVSLCKGTSQTYTFNGNVSVGFNNPVVQWQQRTNGGAWSDIVGATSLNYIRNFPVTTLAGIYSFRLTAAEAGNMNTPQCRVASAILSVEMLNNPPVAATVNTPLCEGGNIILSSSANNVSWSGPNGFVANGSSATINNAQQIHAGKYYGNAMNGSCSRLDSIIVAVHPKPVINISQAETMLCEGDSVQVIASGADNYKWYPASAISADNAATVIMYPADSTTYTVVGKNVSGCADTAAIIINVISKPVANAGPDQSIMEGSAVQLSGNVAGDSINYYWMGANIISVHSLITLAYPVVDTSYILNVVSNAGCRSASDTMTVHVFKKLGIPNAFSPNGDGINDTWNIKGIETYTGATVSIFNRYGQQLFYTNKFTGWDGKSRGKRLSPATYYYIINVHNKLPLISGWLVLLN